MHDPVTPTNEDAAASRLPRTAHQYAGVYVYGIVPATQWQGREGPLHAPAIGGSSDSIRLVRADDSDLAALVSDSPAAEYAISRENLLAHEGVAAEAMSISDVVPLRFGTVATGDEEVREDLLVAQRDLLHDLFERIGGRVELGLNVFWRRRERLFDEIVAEDDAIRPLRDAVRAAKKPSFLQRLELGQLTEQAILRKREQEASRVLAALEPLAVETVLSPVRSDLKILNAAFLVEKALVPGFDAAVSRLEAEESERLTMRYVGPLPPYSFAELAIQGEE
jgi:hypothetical protein